MSDPAPKTTAKHQAHEAECKSAAIAYLKELPHGHKSYIPMPTDPTAPPRDEQRVQITPHIRVLYGATVETDGETWTGWAVWDDYEEISAPSTGRASKFMGFVWEDDCVVCERCADGTWGKYEPHEQAAMNEILAAVKEVSNVD